MGEHHGSPAQQALARSGVPVLPEHGCLVVGGSGAGKTTALRALADQIDADKVWIEGVGRKPALVFGHLVRGLTDPAEIRWRVAEQLTGTGPDTLLLVDDAHLLDEQSAAIVHALIVHDGVRAVVTCAAELDAPVPEAIGALWQDGHLPRHALAPFDAMQIADHLTAVLGGEPATTTVEHLLRWSGGHPGVFTALVGAATAAGGWACAGSVVWLRARPPVTGEVLAAIRPQAEPLTPSVREVLDLFGAVPPEVDEPARGRLPLAAVEQVFSLDALVAAEQAGVLAADDRHVWLTAPYLADWSRATTPSLRLREIAQRLAEALADAGLDGTDADVSALGAGLLTRLHEAPARTEDLRRAVRAALRLGDPDAVLTITAPLDGASSDAAADDPELLAAAVWASLHTGDEAAVRRLVVRGRELDDPAWRALRGSLAGGLRWIAGDLDSRLQRLGGDEEAVLAAVGRQLREHPQAGGWQALIAAENALLVGSVGVARQLLAAAEGAGEQDGLLMSYLALAEIHCELLVGDARRARDLAEDVRGRLAWRSDQAGAAADVACAFADLALGRFGEAAVLLAGARELLTVRAWRSAAGHLSVLTAAVARAEVISEGGLSSTPAGRNPLTISAHSLELSWLAAARGEAERAAALALTTARDLCVAAPLLSVEHLEAALRMLRPGDELLDASAVDEVVSGWGPECRSHDRPRLLAEYAAAWLDRSGARLRGAARGYAELGRLPMAADVWMQAAHAFHDAGDTREAAACAVAGQQLVAEMGGLATPAQRWPAPVAVELTRREREVVELVAQGLGNRAIAERLSLSVRTVEGHILRICVKTGRRSRHDVAALARSVS